MGKNNSFIKPPKYRKNIFFRFLMEKEFSPEQIIIKRKYNILKRNKESESIIENEWRRFLTLGFNPWPTDTAPSRYHFGGIKIVNNKIIIEADPTVSYRDTIGGRSLKLEKIGKKFIPIPLGVVVAIIAKTKSGEEMLGITVRNKKHDFKPGGYSITAGGMMQINNRETAKNSILREIKEETGLNPKDIKGLTCRGITYNRGSKTAGIIFFAKTDLSTDKIISKIHDDENEIIFVPIKKEELERFILKIANACTEDGLAAMALLGKDLYGKGWLKRILKSLALLN